MAKIEKAFILHTDNAKSRGYAKECADSCERWKVPYEYLLGEENLTVEAMEEKYGWTIAPGRYHPDWHNEFLCSLGHALFWQKVVDENKTCAILEHDAIVISNLCNVDIPDDTLAFLGYRVDNRDDYVVPSRPNYKHYETEAFQGTHAIAITPKTAKFLLDTFNKQFPMPIDGMLGINNLSKIRMTVVVPTPTVTEIREKSQTMKDEVCARYNTIPPLEWYEDLRDRQKYSRTKEIGPGQIRVVF
jgi:Glycosyltransferase family 25 (LPS biosynthesis protein)